MNTSYIVDVLDLFMKMLKKKRRLAMAVKGWWFLEQCPSSHHCCSHKLDGDQTDQVIEHRLVLFPRVKTELAGRTFTIAAVDFAKVYRQWYEHREKSVVIAGDYEKT
jgi:hypothetical protein